MHAYKRLQRPGTRLPRDGACMHACARARCRPALTRTRMCVLLRGRCAAQQSPWTHGPATAHRRVSTRGLPGAAATGPTRGTAAPARSQATRTAVPLGGSAAAARGSGRSRAGPGRACGPGVPTLRRRGTHGTDPAGLATTRAPRYRPVGVWRARTARSGGNHVYISPLRVRLSGPRVRTRRPRVAAHGNSGAVCVRACVCLWHDRARVTGSFVLCSPVTTLVTMPLVGVVQRYMCWP